MDAITTLLTSLQLDVNMLKAAFANQMVVGPIEEIDAKKGYRIKLGEDNGKPVLTPWYPHPESGKSWIPLKPGDVVGIMHPSGDSDQGVMFRAGYSKDRPAPSNDIEANVFDDAGVRLEIKDGWLKATTGGLYFLLSDKGVYISIGGFTFDLNSAGLFLNGGRVEHDKLNIGSTHTHGKVVPGPADTDIPNG